MESRKDSGQKIIVTGILAHVDAGKTTLTESMLFSAGVIKKRGKVDRGDVFLDNHALERERGITIFSSQAGLVWNDTRITILDTPGHVDFSAEAERTLHVLDYAVLVISGADGVQGHTRTLWDLLRRYDIPVFLFINKMDLPGKGRENLIEELKTLLDDGCVDFTEAESAVCREEIASCSEEAMEAYFSKGTVEDALIRRMIWERRLFPCYFGSALNGTGVSEFLDGFARFTLRKTYPAEFGARVYKITRDPSGNRLTHLKVTGGTLRVRETLRGGMPGAGSSDGIPERELALDNSWEEKVNQIRIYNGEKFDVTTEAGAGEVCAVTGLAHTYPGEGLGFEAEGAAPLTEPVLSRQILLPEGTDAGTLLPKLRMLEEEQPELALVWDERLQEIRAQVMGEVQIEVLRSLIAERFGVDVDFGPPRILYKETILEPVEGVGHFEPMRHYAEVHLLLEPLPQGSGLVFSTDCSEDLLDKNWQRLILTHLEERTHRGVLTGSPITDMKITVIAGRAHPRHTVGGDFRQATYRAVRQGLMETTCRVLEPYYEFCLEVPEQAVGRAMSDIERMDGSFESPSIAGGRAVLSGRAPVTCMQDYRREVASYTKGFGRLSLAPHGYGPCHNEDEVIEALGYDPEADTYQTPDSVFCANGSGFTVPWDRVKEFMHVESPLTAVRETPEETMESARRQARTVSGRFLAEEEVEAILDRATQANRSAKDSGQRDGERVGRREQSDPVKKTFHSREPREEYLIVDGYNVIHAWDELADLMRDNLDAARGRLMDELCNYQGAKKMNLIVVFDAYRVEGHETEISDYHNIHVVFTKEAETADQYIEKFAHTHGEKYDVTVATSDGLEQIIIRGEGCRLLSSRDLIADMFRVRAEFREAYGRPLPLGRSEEMRQALDAAMEEET